MFKVNDYVIYKRDLCKIKEITDNKGVLFYKLAPLDDESLIIRIPVDNKQNNLRYPISKEESEELIKKIPLIKEIDTKDKVLDNIYKELMKTNKHEDLIRIIKTTYLRNQKRLEEGKKILDKDSNYFEKAEKYLYNELSISLGMNYDECKQYVISKLSAIDNSNNL